MRSCGRRVRRTAVLPVPSAPLMSTKGAGVYLPMSAISIAADKSTLNCFFPASQERFHVVVPDRAEIRSLQRNGVTAKKGEFCLGLLRLYYSGGGSDSTQRSSTSRLILGRWSWPASILPMSISTRVPRSPGGRSRSTEDGAGRITVCGLLLLSLR